MTAGPWRYDATPRERGSIGNNATNGEGRETWQLWGYVDAADPTGLPQDALALALSGTPSTPNPAYAPTGPAEPTSQAGLFAQIETGIHYLDGPGVYQGAAQWSIGYARHSFGDQTGDYSGSLSDLPPDVWDPDAYAFVDPNVIDVEWGTEPIPTGNTRLQVQLLAGNYDAPGRTWRIMYRADPTDSEVPGFRTRTELLGAFTALPQVITTADIDSISGGTYSLPWWSVGGIGDLFAGNRVILALVDQDVTINGGTVPDSAPSWGVTATTNIRQEYRLPYRLIYGTTIAPPLRQYPRSDGLAVSSARRMWPPSRSYQRGIRRAGGYL